jgi:hypothetical protein
MTEQHIDDNGKHVDELDGRLRDLAASFGDLGSSDDFDELFRIIHRGGWTTVIDVAFMHSLIDATQRTVEDARQLRNAMLEGARAIGEASAALV